MALAAAIKGAKRPSQTITWTRADGTAEDLSGATLAGYIRNLRTGETRAIDGTLTLVTAASGIFSWDYGDNDVSEAGEAFVVQFVASFGSDPTPAKTVASTWTVYDGLSV